METIFKITCDFYSVCLQSDRMLNLPESGRCKTYQTQDNYIGGGGCSVVISGNKVYYSITETEKSSAMISKRRRQKPFPKQVEKDLEA